VKLAVYIGFPTFIITNKSPIFVYFTVWVLFSGWIGGFIPDVEEIVIKDEFIGSQILTSSRLTGS
jgi:hypothetical protein